ncbi:MAG: hypothetical protein Q9173_000111 [Seirophora scorigena]
MPVQTRGQGRPAPTPSPKIQARSSKTREGTPQRTTKRNNLVTTDTESTAVTNIEVTSLTKAEPPSVTEAEPAPVTKVEPAPVADAGPTLTKMGLTAADHAFTAILDTWAKGLLIPGLGVRYRAVSVGFYLCGLL